MRILALLLLVACGRIGFEESSPTPSQIDGSTGPQPDGSAAGCTPACDVDEYCRTPVGMCSAQGTCTTIPTEPSEPTACPDALVCGCDGKMYANACAAAAAGVSISGQFCSS